MPADQKTDEGIEIETAEFLAVSPAGGMARPPTVSVEISALSHPGLVRDRNEDHFLVARISRSLDVLMTNLPPEEVILRPEERGYGLVVADGMGGMAAGEQASMLALRTGMKLVLDASKWALRIDDAEAEALMGRMRAYFRKVDEVITEQARSDPRLAGMATTLTLAYSVGWDLFLVHAGDTRTYHYRDGVLQRLTRDHNVAQLLADTGRIAPEEVSTHSKRHVVTNFAGGPIGGIAPDVTRHRLIDGDRVLVCSDGLHGLVPDDVIARVIGSNDDLDAATIALIDEALARGGRDNVTVVLARYSG